MPATASHHACPYHRPLVRESALVRCPVFMRLPSSAAGRWVAVERWALLGAAAALLVACGAKEGAGGAAAAPGGGRPQIPPAQVGVVTVQPRPVALRTELPGRVEALRVAQVR